MKKTIALIALTSLLFISCKKEEAAAPVAATNELPATADGYTTHESENIELIKKCNACWENSKVAEYKAYYADDAVFHDNGTQTTLAENISNNNNFQKMGIKPTMKYDEIWESIDNKANKKGVKNYVLAYCTNTWTKGTKSIKAVVFQVDAIKDGKIVEEWNIYDSAKLMELMNSK